MLSLIKANEILERIDKPNYYLTYQGVQHPLYTIFTRTIISSTNDESWFVLPHPQPNKNIYLGIEATLIAYPIYNSKENLMTLYNEEDWEGEPIGALGGQIYSILQNKGNISLSNYLNDILSKKPNDYLLPYWELGDSDLVDFIVSNFLRIINYPNTETPIDNTFNLILRVGYNTNNSLIRYVSSKKAWATVGDFAVRNTENQWVDNSTGAVTPPLYYPFIFFIQNDTVVLAFNFILCNENGEPLQ